MEPKDVNEIVDYAYDHVRQYMYNFQVNEKLPSQEEIERICSELYVKLCHMSGHLSDEDLKYINECPTSRCFVVCSTAEDRNKVVEEICRVEKEEAVIQFVLPMEDKEDVEATRVQDSESQLHLFQDATEGHQGSVPDNGIDT
jgi:hypothetical protein